MTNEKPEAAAILELVFPEGNFEKLRNKINYSRIEGLSKGTIPRNIEVLMSGNEQYAHEKGERREHFLLLNAGGYTFFLRVFDAMNGSPYQKMLNTNPINTPENLKTVINTLLTDITKYSLKQNYKNIIVLEDNLNQYKITLDSMSIEPCMQSNYYRINKVIDAYLNAIIILKTNMKKIPSEFNTYIQDANPMQLEDETDMTTKMALKKAIGKGYASEPAYLAYQLVQFGIAKLEHTTNTKNICN